MAPSPLFEPVRIGTVELPGRLVKSATTETRCTDDGFVTEELIRYYEQIAAGGTPLLITGNAYFDVYSKAAPRQLAADSDDKIPGLRRLTDAVHRHGARIFLQIYHVGRQALPRLAGRREAVSASAVFEPALGVRPREITQEEIQGVVRGLAQAAGRGKQAGFDGVQIHAAHGYLISAFLTPHTNRRTDEYGGPLENRMRLLVQVYRAVRDEVGPSFPVILKINGSDELFLRRGLGPAETVAIAKRMEEEGIDAVEVSCGHYESGFPFERGRWKGFFSTVTTIGIGRHLPWYHRYAARALAPILDRALERIAPYREGFNLPYARQFKKALSIPVLCVGGFLHKEAMEQAIAGGACDLVSVARALIADPLLYRHLQEGVPGPQCDFCNACYARGASWPVDCYNEAVRQERDHMLARELGDSVPLGALKGRRQELR
jgi:2,4-dienoyl-CoA reductase-like NADH-dependent reductase (Old Yellow Enzyme family)